ncbi:TetR/AcrR family transcriptional regulator [Desulfitibacter alkalitolerans]|uniref:TetR/AcrR family transcriptional regulator n=1 Tax=Desulfitibacter alkalitolerans TaxID=264641 RepID=UPI0004810842|nr:TetR/AcrR family transcriptional regulator [Desulfitibacter alkalitolerans]
MADNKERGHTSDKASRSVPKLESSGKREQILEAAIKVFACKGFYHARVEEIAIEAKIGKGTVYEYFKSKQDLFQEMFKYIHNLYLEKIMADIEKRYTFKEKVSYILEAHLRFILEHKEMAQVFLAEHPPLDDDFKKWFLDLEKQKLQFLQNNVIDGIKRDELKDLDPSLIARIIAGVISYFGSCTILNGLETADGDLTALSADTIELLYSGIGQ